MRRSTHKSHPWPLIIGPALALMIIAVIAINEHQQQPTTTTSKQNPVFQVTTKHTRTQSQPMAGSPAIKPTLSASAATAGAPAYAPTYTTADAIAFAKQTEPFGAFCAPHTTCTVLNAVFMTAQQANTQYQIPLMSRPDLYPFCLVEYQGTFSGVLVGPNPPTWTYAIAVFDGRTGNLLGTTLRNTP